MPGLSGRLDWRFGFVDAAELDSADHAVERLLGAPDGRFLRRLRVHGDSQPAIEVLVRRRPRALRELAFAVRYLARPSLGRVDWLWSALPWIEVLELHGSGGTLGVPDAPALRKLELDVPVEDAVAAVEVARWPALSTLHLVAPFVQERHVRWLARCFWARSLEGVRHLGIIGCHEFRRVGPELVASPLARHIESLDLTGSRVGTQGARLLAQNRERLECLRRVVVGDLDQRGREVLREAGW